MDRFQIAEPCIFGYHRKVQGENPKYPKKGLAKSMKKEREVYGFFSSDEFSALSDAEKSDYYNSLANERRDALTVEQKELLAQAYRAIGKYRSAPHFADELMDEAAKQRKADEEYYLQRKKQGVKVIALICAALFVLIVVVTAVSMLDTKGKKYDRAVELYNSGNYSEALEIFETISKYDDSDLYITSIKGMLSTGTVGGMRARVGDRVNWGKWYKDGDPTAEKVEVEWIVIGVDQEKKRAFMISADILSAQPFGTTDIWKNSEMLSWLNGEFLDGAFSATEKAQIATVLYGEYNKDAEQVIGFSSKVALISRDEKNEYLTDVVNLKAEGAGQSEWWMRTPTDDGAIVYVSESGQVATAGKNPGETLGVRPVIWVNFD